MEELKITVNGIEFREIPYDTFIIYGEEDRIPFMDSCKTDGSSTFPLIKEAGRFPYRTYKALIINQRFFAPKLDQL